MFTSLPNILFAHSFAHFDVIIVQSKKECRVFLASKTLLHMRTLGFLNDNICGDIWMITPGKECYTSLLVILVSLFTCDVI